MKHLNVINNYLNILEMRFLLILYYALRLNLSPDSPYKVISTRTFKNFVAFF